MQSTALAQRHLIAGTLSAIYNEQPLPQQQTQPWLQVTQIRKMQVTKSGEGTTTLPDRYRLTVSDGVHCHTALLGSSLNDLVTNGVISRFCLVHVHHFLLNKLPTKNARIIVLLELDVNNIIYCDSEFGQPQMIDNPMGPNTSSSTATSFPAATPTTSMPTAMPTSTPMPPPIQASSKMTPSYAPPPTKSAPVKPMPTPAASTLTSDLIHPIDSLSPYQSKWTICARITQKSEMRHYANARGEGRLFSVTLMDASGEIKATLFNEAADKYFPIMSVNKVYYISKGSVKIAKRQFSHVQNDYELSLDLQSLIQEAPSADASLPQLHYSFTPIDQLVSVAKDSTVDVLGLVMEVGAMSSITTKTTQKQLAKRDLTLVDASNVRIRLTLWGSQAEEERDWLHCILALKGVRVGEYQGKTLSTTNTTQLAVNPDLKEAHYLRGWFEQGHAENSTPIQGTGQATSNSSFSTGSRMTLSQLTPDVTSFQVAASIVFIRSENNISYAACATCNKKVIETSPGQFRCEKCQRSTDTCEHRYILNCSVSDSTGQQWMTLFNEQAERLLGKSANEVLALKATEPSRYSALFKAACFQSFLFKGRLSQEVYQGESKLRCTVSAMQPLQYREECQYLCEQLTAYGL